MTVPAHTRTNDPRVVNKAIRDRHAATVAAIRTMLGSRATPEATDLLGGLSALLAADGHLNDATAFLLESNVAAARTRREQAEAAAAAEKPAKRAPLGAALAQ